MKNTIYIAMGIAVAVLVGMLLIHEKTYANPSNIGLTSLSQSLSLANPLAIASSSQVYLVVGNATTTFVANTDGADQFDVNTYLIASSTSTSLNYSVDYSDDIGCYASPSSCNWYREDAVTLSGAVRTMAPLAIRTFAPVTIASSTSSFRVTSVGARFTRIGITAVGANGSVWIQLAAKDQRP